MFSVYYSLVEGMKRIGQCVTRIYFVDVSVRLRNVYIV